MYIISHDLKAPLRAINALTDWIAADYAEKFDDDGKEQLKMLTTRVNRMQNLLDGVLQYSRIGRVKEDPASIDLNQLLREIIKRLTPPRIFMSPSKENCLLSLSSRHAYSRYSSICSATP